MYCYRCDENIIPKTFLNGLTIYLTSWIIGVIFSFIMVVLLESFSIAAPLLWFFATIIGTCFVCHQIEKRGICPHCDNDNLRNYSNDCYNHPMYSDAMSFPWTIVRPRSKKIKTLIICLIMVFSPMYLFGPFVYLRYRSFNHYLPYEFIPSNIEGSTFDKESLFDAYMSHSKESRRKFESLNDVPVILKGSNNYPDNLQEKNAAIYHPLNGVEFEQHCAELLKRNGYRVTITKATGDYGVDIIATSNSGIKYAVQCKRYSNPVSLKAVQEVVAGMRMYGCDSGIVMTNSTFTKSAIELAKANGVLLWDGSHLRKL